VPHSSDETLDPRTHLPVLTQERAPLQTTDLPTERTESSIPRDAAGNWDYPSPQQFYNALVRKGFPTPENEVETMVQIHNFLNEAAWDEVQKWEAQENKCVFVFSLQVDHASNGCVCLVWQGRGATTRALQRASG
jgi:cytochrome c heme-lyase